MVDSHVLVGSCAQIGARVHLSAGVSIGGVLEPAGARPVIVEDGAFVGAGSSLLEGVLVGEGAVIGAGVILTGTSRLYDLVRGRRAHRHARGAARRAAGVRGGARVAYPRRGVRRGQRPVRLGRAAGQGPRRRHGRPGRPGGRAAMNEILRDGRLGGHDPAELAERFGTPFYAYDLDVVTRQVDGAPGDRCRPSFDLAYAVKANPNLAVLRHLAGLGLGADVASGGELRHVLRAGFAAGRRSCSRAPASATRSWRRPSRPACASSRWSRPASCGAWRGSRRDSAAASRSCCGPPCPRPADPERVPASSATTSRASSGWTPRTCGPPRPRRSRRPGWSRSASTRSGRRT